MANVFPIAGNKPMSMAASDDQNRYAVVMGNLIEGFTFLGPFPTYVSAEHLGRELNVGDPQGVAGCNDTWWVVPLQDPTFVRQAMDSQTDSL